MSDLNAISIEKQNLLLTCYKNEKDHESLGKSGKHDKDKDNKDNKYEKMRKYLKCDRFLDTDSLQTIQVPRFNEWIKKYKFV